MLYVNGSKTPKDYSKSSTERHRHQLSLYFACLVESSAQSIITLYEQFQACAYRGRQLAWAHTTLIVLELITSFFYKSERININWATFSSCCLISNTSENWTNNRTCGWDHDCLKACYSHLIVHFEALKSPQGSHRLSYAFANAVDNVSFWFQLNQSQICDFFFAAANSSMIKWTKNDVSSRDSPAVHSEGHQQKLPLTK